MDISEWMDMALAQAKTSLSLGEVPVGCLFIYKNEIIATSSNKVNETRNATRHAEMDCIDMVLKTCESNSWDYTEIFPEIDVVVTVEPCIMCTSALIQLKVRRVTYGCANTRFGGCKSVFEVEKIYPHKMTIEGGIKEDQAMSLLKDFYKGVNPNAPKKNKIQ